MDIFRKNLSLFMDKTDIKQMDIANKLGVKQSSVSLMLSGKRSFMEYQIYGIAELLNIEPYELFLTDTQKMEIDKMQDYEELITLMDIPEIKQAILSELSKCKKLFKDEINNFEGKKNTSAISSLLQSGIRSAKKQGTNSNRL